MYIYIYVYMYIYVYIQKGETAMDQNIYCQRLIQDFSN